MSSTARSSRHPLRLAVALALAVGTLAAPAAFPALAPAAHAQDSSAVTVAQTITNAKTGQTFDVTVEVDQTRGLVDRQQLAVNLEGFTPSYRTGFTAQFGQAMQYPVLAMQCRGTVPTRETCASEWRNRYFDAADAGYAEMDVAQIRAHAAAMGIPDGLIRRFDNEKPGDFRQASAETYRAMRTPYEAAPTAPGVAPISYLWEPDPADTDLDGAPDPPFLDEPTLKSSRPPDVSSTADVGAPLNLRAIPVRPDGTNEFLFEARERSSLPSLGCSDTVPCSLVLVPIMDMACVEGAPAGCGQPVPADAQPGGGSFSSTAGDRYRSPETWHVPSNWDNRLVVPLSFQPDLATCDIRDPRPSLPLFGSELADVAQQRYGGAFCADARSADYLPIYSAGSEYEARRNFTTRLGSRYGQDAVLTSQPVLESPDSPRKVVHAPTALTGFTVAFTIDDTNGQQVRQMTLNPRLLAKLTTQSYITPLLDVFKTGRTNYTGQLITSQEQASTYYVEHPDARTNPGSLLKDPEFRELNPGIDPELFGAAAPVMLTVQSDVVLELSRYIASDEKARIWLAGKADEWGMRVNPAWQTPAADQPRLSEIYTLRDQWIKPAAPRLPNWSDATEQTTQQLYFLIGAGDECDRELRTPSLTRQADITSSLEASALALLDRRGSATSACGVQLLQVPEDRRPAVPAFPGDTPDVDADFTEKKSIPSDFGSRRMIAVTTVGHAELYRLPTARLTNASGTAVAPRPGTMLAALAAAEQDSATGTLRMNHAEIRGDAYPGTMVAYIALPTVGLERGLAGQYAAFVEFMTTTGQRPGPPGSTGLPAGYDPLPPNMVSQAADAAAAVRDQTGEVPAPPPDGPLGGGLPEGFEAGPGGSVTPTGTGTPTPGSAASRTTPTSPSGAAGTGASPVDPAGAPQAAGPAYPAGPGAGAVPRTVAQTRGEQSWLARWALPILLIVGVSAGVVAMIVRTAGDPNHPAHALRSQLLALAQRPRT